MSTTNFEPIESALISKPARAGYGLNEITERVAGAALLALASPVIAASALTLSVLSKRSPLIAHLRVARDGEAFWMLKLRTMWPEPQSRSEANGWIERIVADPVDDDKDPSDARVSSRFAAFCRRHSIDELPQLWHVACGEMSLVGPRPLTQAEINRYYAASSVELLSVKPGLTGLWQIRGRSAVRFPRRAAMDLELVRSLTRKMYWKILARTIPAIIKGNGAW
ncbi:MAG TPA: sugar transferase [Bryobacteraceae bacterium]|nr:sugar transferase [Bryobacteraceae bacterium]